MIEIETEIDGTPCIARLTHYAPGTNRMINSASLEPNDPEELEFVICDMDGEQDETLYGQMTQRDQWRVADKLLAEIKSENNYRGF